MNSAEDPSAQSIEAWMTYQSAWSRRSWKRSEWESEADPSKTLRILVQTDDALQ